MFLPHCDVLCDILLSTDARQHGIYLFYIIKQQNLSQLLESGPSPTLASTKKPVWRNLLSMQNEVIYLVVMRSKDLWLVRKNHATVKFDLKWLLVEWTTYSESRIEQRNLQILKKMLEKSSQFFVIRATLWTEGLDVALNIARVKRIRSVNLRLRLRLH